MVFTFKERLGADGKGFKFPNLNLFSKKTPEQYIKIDSYLKQQERYNLFVCMYFQPKRKS